MSGKKLDKEKLVNYLLKSSNYDLDEYLNIDHFSRIFVNSPNLPQKIIFVLSFNHMHEDDRHPTDQLEIILEDTGVEIKYVLPKIDRNQIGNFHMIEHRNNYTYDQIWYDVQKDYLRVKDDR